MDLDKETAINDRLVLPHAELVDLRLDLSEIEHKGVVLTMQKIAHQLMRQR